MKRLLQRIGLLLGFSALLWTGVWGQQQITIGTYNVDNPSLLHTPIALFYNNSISQTIYTKAELQDLAGSMITGLSYTMGGTPSKDFSGTQVDIYIGLTELDAFPEARFLTTAGLEKVAEIDLGKFESSVWNITFDKPYAYDASSNLIVCLVRRGTTWENVTFQCADNGTDPELKQSLYAHTDGGELSKENLEEIDLSGMGDKKGYGKFRPVTGFTYELRSENAVLKLSTQTLNFGWQRAGKPESVSFRISNPGSKPLTISSVSGGAMAVGTIMPDPTGTTIQPDASVEYTYTLDGSAGTYEEDIVFTAAEAEPSSATLHISAFVYPETALLEDFEKGMDLPMFFRNRTGHCRVSATNGNAYDGNRYIEFNAWNADTLIMPKADGGSLHFYLKRNSMYDAANCTLLQSQDLETWTVAAWQQPELSTTTYTEVAVDLPESGYYLALAGKGFSLDRVLMTAPVWPVHDLNFVSWTLPEDLKEKTEATFEVTVSNWGASEEQVKLILVDQDENVLVEQHFDTPLASREQATFGLAWTPAEKDRGVTALQCRIELEGDEDETNQTSPIADMTVIPYLPVAVLEPAEIFFDALAPEQDRDTVICKLSNKGIAPLNVSDLQVGAPFSVYTAHSFSVPAGEEFEMGIVLTRGESVGVQTSQIVLTYDEEMLVLPVAGMIRGENSLCESFESAEWPPLKWRKRSASEETKGWQHSQYGAKDGNWYVQQSGSLSDTLITPLLEVTAGEKLLFWAAAREGNGLLLLYSNDLSEWKSWKDYTAAGESPELSYAWKGCTAEWPESGRFHVAFVAQKGVLIDYIQGSPVVVSEKDLRLAAVPVLPVFGNKYTEIGYEVLVRNIGSLTAENYSVQLVQGEKVLAETSGLAVGPNDTVAVSLRYLPLEEGVLENLRFRIVYEGDADEEDNYSEPFMLTIRPEFYGESLLGSDAAPADSYGTMSNGFWVSNWNYSLTETHFTSSQVNMRRGSGITGISYAIYNSSNTPTVPLKIWLGEKTPEQDIKNSWSDPEEMTLVYEGETTVPEVALGTVGWGELSLDIPYVYQGGDLVVLVERVYNGSTYRNVSFVKNTNSVQCRRSYQEDVAEDASLEKALASTPTADETYATIKLLYTLPGIQVTGTVQDPDGNALAGATVRMSEGDVVYVVETDAEGRFVLEMSRTGQTYILTVEYGDLAFSPMNIAIGEEDLDMGILKMTDRPVSLKLAVTGKEAMPLTGLYTELRSDANEAVMTQTYSGSGFADTLVFENLAAGLYRGTLTHPLYRTYAFEAELADKDSILAIELEERAAIEVSGKVLSSMTGTALAGVTVSLQSTTVGATCRDTTDEAGVYRLPVQLTGEKYVRTLSAVSHKPYVDTVAIPLTEEDYALGDVTLQLENIIVALTLRSPDGTDMTGATVRLVHNGEAEISYETKALNGGLAVFDNLRPGSYTLTVLRAEAVVYTDEDFVIIESRNEEITVGQPVGRGTLTIRIVPDNGESAFQSEIYLMNDYSGVTYNEVVDSSGVRVFEAISFGKYMLGVYKDGFYSYEEEIMFTATTTLTIELKEQRVAPYALEAEVVYSSQTGQADIEMEWNNIGAFYYDSFEDYEDFSIDFKPWTLHDLDKRGTASVNNVKYPHAGEPMAAMVFNPYATVPASTNTAFAPLTGAKYMAFFNAVGAPSDDWAIAPKRMIRHGDMLQVSFRQLVAGAPAEHFTICVSTTGTDPEDFHVFSNGNYIASSAEWMTFMADMSFYAGQEIYVAIHCFSNNTGDMLMIDDFFIGFIPDDFKSLPAGKWLAAPQKAMYRIYMDGVLTDSVESPKYTFTNVPAGKHTVGVSQMYKGGESAITTAELTVDDFKEAAARWELKLSANTGESCGSAAVSLQDEAGKTTVYPVSDDKVTVNYLRKGTYTLKVSMEGFEPVSQVLQHDKADVTEIELKENLVVPSGLFVDVDYKDGVYLGMFSWNTRVGFNEGFESYADFTQDLSPWKNLDRDGLYNFGVSNCTFPGMGEPSAAVVYNPSATSPSSFSDRNARSHSGSKHVVFFSTDQGTPDDWLISPVQEIRDNYELRFFAKSYTTMYGAESVEVLISETDTAVASFLLVERFANLPVDWTEYRLDLSAYRGRSIYIAFRYAQANTFYMLLDDVYVGPALGTKAGESRAKSYNVYLDGEMLVNKTETEHVFKNLQPERTYTAGVEAVYASGVSERATYTFTVNPVVASEEYPDAGSAVEACPNPVRSGAELQLTSVSPLYSVRLLDRSGGEVWRKALSSARSERLQIPAVPGGMYILEVRTAQGVSFLKLIVL